MKRRKGIGFRIMSMAIVLSMIAAIIGCLGLLTTKKTSELAVEMYHKDLLGVQYAQDMDYYMQTTVVNTIAANRPGKTVDEIKNYENQYVNTVTAFNQAVTNYESIKRTQEETELLKTIKKVGKDYTEKGLMMFNYTLKGDLDGANKYTDTILAPLWIKTLNPAITKLVQISSENGEKAHERAESISSAALSSIIIAILLGLTISLILGIMTTRNITKSVSNIVENLSDSSGQIALSSMQLSASSQEIANGAQKQAASIEETSASMEELSSMVKQNLGNIRQASLLSERATTASQNGFDKMNDMLSAMSGISKSTEDIKNVIDVIDDIAFQTNMLALNAAVEAARAGEAGMGFAVVADEVKNLANRSSQSAKETAAMIKDTLKNIEKGLSVSSNLSEIFKDILVNSKKVMEMNREVETASEQQDEGIGQINTALVQFNSVIQTNASSAEETASAAEELQGQVENLNGIVDTLYVIVTGNSYRNDQAERYVGGASGKKRTSSFESQPSISDSMTSEKKTDKSSIQRKVSTEQKPAIKGTAVTTIRKDAESEPV